MEPKSVLNGERKIIISFLLNELLMHRWEWGKGRLKRIYSNSATRDKDEFLADSEEENENVVEDVHVIPLEILEARFDRNDIIVECIS